MLVEAGVPGSGGAQRPSPHKRAAGEENFGPEKPKQINKNRRRSPQSSPAGEARRLRALGLLVGLSAASCCSCWLGCYYQLGSSHDTVHLLGSHNGPPAAGELVGRVGQGVRRTSRRLARDARRVSAAFRRGAAAYGVASRAFEEARTHGCLLS